MESGIGLAEVRTQAEKLRILALGDLQPDLLEAHGHAVTVLKARQPRASELASIDVIIVRSPYSVDRSMIEKSPSLRAIIRAGTGLDNIDTVLAKRRGIKIFSAPVSAPAVAEHAFALLLSLARNVVVLNCSMQAGEWNKNSQRGFELRGKRLAIVGFGRIGREIALIARGFGMKITIVDPTPDKKEKRARMREVKAVEVMPFDEALAVADVVMLCCPLNRDTDGMLNERRIALLRRSAVVVNVARGALVDLRSLEIAIREGRLAGAGLDVHCPEPPGALALFKMPQVVATPHVGAQTFETQMRIAQMVLSLTSSLAYDDTGAAR